MLSRLGLWYNPVMRGLICLDCGWAILRSAALQHARRAHGVPHSACNQETFDNALASVAPIAQVMDSFPSELDLETRSPFEGLTVYRNRYQCGLTNCRQCFCKLSSMKEHWRTAHSKTHGSQVQSKCVNLQRFHDGAGPGRSYFPVLETHLQEKKVGEAVADDYVFQIRKQLEKDRVAESTESLDYRLFPPWIHLTRFARHTQGLDPGALNALVKIPRKGAELCLMRALEGIFETATKKLDKTPDLILQRLNTDLNTPYVDQVRSISAQGLNVYAGS